MPIYLNRARQHWKGLRLEQQVFVIFALATFFFAAMIACAKALSSYPVVGIVFFRNFVSLCLIALILLRSASRTVLRTKRLGTHLWRGIFGITSMLCYFASYRYLPLAEASAITHAQPIILAVLSVLLLREPSYRHRWIGVACGFLGVIVMLNPRGAGIGFGSLLALGGALFGALAMVMVRRLGQTEKSTTVVFYFMLWGSMVTGILLPWYWRTPDGRELLLLVGAGIFGAIAQLLMVEGYRIAEASLVASLNYLQLVWSALLGFVIWREVPRISVVVGVVIVMLSQLYMIRSERRSDRKAAPGEAITL